MLRLNLNKEESINGQGTGMLTCSEITNSNVNKSYFKSRLKQMQSELNLKSTYPPRTMKTFLE